MYQANINQKEKKRSCLYGFQVDFRRKKIIRDKEEHCIMAKGSTYQDKGKTVSFIKNS